MLVIAASSLEDFASNVRQADTLALLTFRRAVDAVNSQGTLTEKDVQARIDLARRANAQAAEVKAQRLEVLDKFENISDAPRPANIEYTVVQAPLRQQIARLRALGYEREAAELEASMNGVTAEDDE
ncbi:MAG: hypothetical protein VW239_02865 [Candidatus Nanopelagicales bacterium]